MDVLGTIKGLFYERDTSGNHVYTIDNADFSENLSKVSAYSQNHPLMTTALDFVSQIFSRAEFWIEKDGVRIDDHWLIDLMNKPGFGLTKNDFLRQVYFNSVATGTSIVYPIKAVGYGQPQALRLIDTLKTRFPNLSIRRYKTGVYTGLRIMYDENFEDSKIDVDKLIFIRDLPVLPFNVSTANEEINSRYVFTSRSRFEGQIQTLYNTVVSLEAKEIILKTNGKELYSSKGRVGDSAMGEKERDEIKTKINNNHGLTKKRSRSIVTKSDLDWKSLHIALRDLGLDESVKTDGNLIFGTLQIPRDIMSLDLKKASYQNQKESMVAYIQNVMQPKIDDFTETLTNTLLGDGYKLKGGYEHLPVMQYILDQKYKGIYELGRAMNELLKANLKFKDVLNLLGLPKDIKQDDKRIEQAAQQAAATEGADPEGTEGENE